MASSAAVTGLNVFAVDGYVGSTADPARFVVDCEPTTDFPETVTINLYSQGVTLTFANCRLVTRPRVTRFGARAVYEDARWSLREAVMGRSFNSQTPDGRIDSATVATLEELWDEIAAASGLLIAYQNLPEILVPSPWVGMTALDAANQLLERSVCRMTLNHSTGAYTVMPAATGALPDVSARTFRPVSMVRPATVKIESAPKLYESRVTCNAVVPDSNWSMSTFSAVGVDPNEVWDGFSSEIPSRRESIQASAFRVWDPDSVSFPEALSASRISLLPYRLMQICPAADLPLMVGPQAVNFRMSYAPSVYRTGLSDGKSDIPGTMLDGRRIVTDRPVIVPDASGDVSTELDFICAFHVVETGGELRRASKQLSVTGGTGAELVVRADWIKAAESDVIYSPVDDSDSTALLDAVAALVQARESAEPQHVRIAKVFDVGVTGQVGGIRYRVQMYPSRMAETSIAVNFVPNGSIGL